MREFVYYLVLIALGLSGCATPTPAPSSPTPTIALPSPTPTPSAPAPTPTPTPSPMPATATPTPTPLPPTATPTPPSPTPAVPIPTPPLMPYEDLSHPIATLASYYNAINLREFERAYGYWAAPPKPYDDFVAGFADTLVAKLIVGPQAMPVAGDTPVGVPVILLAWHRDGSEHAFYGCFYLAPGPEETHPPHWYIQDATIHVTPNRDITLLQHACDPMQSVLYRPVYDRGDHPVDVIVSYYNAIVNHDYERAYGYWENPPLPYDDFVAGFADTSSAFVALIPPVLIEGAAGSQYTAVPTLILALHHDGSRPTFNGCFTTRRPNPDMVGELMPWRLYSARVEAIPGNGTDAHYLLTGEETCP